MSKTLFIGHYRDHTGYGAACTDYLLSLAEIGADVVCRPIKLNNTYAPIPKKIEEMESRSSEGCSVVIQHTLPQYFSYTPKMRSIGMFATESSDFRSTNWSKYCNLMDEIIVFSHYSKEVCLKSGVTIPIHVVPHACDTTKFERQYTPLIPHNGTFRFLFIGELIKRKNLAALIRAFHTAFGREEDVELIIKTGVPGQTGEQAAKTVVDFINQVKAGLKKYASVDAYKRETIIVDRLSDEDILRLHRSCHCLVSPSFGEGFCIPAMDSLGMGNPVITTGAGPVTDFVNERNGWLVRSMEDSVFGATDTFSDLYTSESVWNYINIRDLGNCMQNAFFQWSERHKESRWFDMKNAASDTPYKFSYNVVGNKLRKILL